MKNTAKKCPSKSPSIKLREKSNAPISHHSTSVPRTNQPSKAKDHPNKHYKMTTPYEECEIIMLLPKLASWPTVSQRTHARNSQPIGTLRSTAPSTR